MRKQTWLWIFVFTAFAVIATAYLMVWASPRPAMWGFPSWVFPFAGIHLGFTAAVWAFTRWYWEDENEES